MTKRRIIPFFCWLLMGPLAFGQTTNAMSPKVLHDSGNTTPISEVFGTLPETTEYQSPPNPAPVSINGSFPIETPSMSLGRFANAPWPQHFGWRGAPLFLFGGDQHSLAWLHANQDRLRALGATGILIEAPTEASLGAAKQAAPGIPIMAAPGEEIANRTGLRLYPVIITREGIEQ